MLRLIADLKAMPVPAEAGITPDALVSAVISLEGTLLTKRFGLEGPRLDEDVLGQLARYSMWLEGLAASNALKGLDASRAAFVAGSIRELLFHERGEWSDRDQALALCMSLRASSHPQLGMKLAGQIEIAGTDGVLSRFTRSIVGFLSGNHFEAIEGYWKGMQRLGRVDRYSLTESDMARLATYQVLARSAGRHAWSLISGDSELAGEAEQVEEDLERLLTAPLHNLMARWNAATAAVLRRSVVRELQEAGFSQRYVELLASDRVLEFWPQQLAVVKEGLFESGPSVIGLPTGSGKTLLAELALAKVLEAREQNWGCYVAPSRALVHQVARALARRLGPAGMRVRTVVGGPEETGFMEAELSELTQGRTVTVATPERLDAYYRIEPGRFDSMAVMVVDEAQAIGDGARGILLEQLIAKVRVRQPECKLVILSAGGSNTEELEAWLGEATTSSFADDRVTRQQLAVAVRLVSEKENLNEWVHDGEHRRSFFVMGGLVTAAAVEQDATDGRGIPVGVAGCFRTRVREQLAGDAWKEMDSSASSVDHAAQMAAKLHANDQSTLVFCPTQTSARGQAIKLAENLGENDDPATGDLVEALATRIGGTHPLISCVERGVAYHHASLPITVLRLLEYGFERTLIRTLFATSTLREGVNLPAANVIIAGEKRFDETTGRAQDVPVTDFINLAGRAGRPQYDREGLAVLVPGRLSRAKWIADHYLLHGRDALAVHSAMQHLIDSLSGSHESIIETLETSEQSLVMSLFASGLRERTDFAALFSSTLASVQIDFDAGEVAENLYEGFEKLKSSLGEEFVESMSKTGLGLVGAQAISTFVENNVAILVAGDNQANYTPEKNELLKACVLACRAVPEVRRRRLERDAVWEDESLMSVIQLWISGASYVEVAEADMFRESEDAVGEAVSFLADVSQWLPWPLGAMQLALRARGLEPDPFIGHLPGYMRFGVPNGTAAMFSLAGIFDRESAIRFGDLPQYQGASLADISQVLQEGLPEESGVGPPMHAVLHGGSSQIRLTKLSFRTMESVEVGVPIHAERSDDGVVIRDLERGTVLGEVGGIRLRGESAPGVVTNVADNRVRALVVNFD